MPETDIYTNRLYKYKNKEKCKDSVVYKATNPRYPLYKQIFFTAADYYDLERYGILYARECMMTHSSETKGHYHFQHVLNTIKYMFDGFKKGVMVVIKNNRLKVFLPFANANHMWDDISKFLPIPQELRNTKNIELDVRRWGINNCIFKEKKNFTEGDQSYTELRYLLRLLLKHKSVPDIVLFFNLRDFPIVKKGFFHPYDNIVPPSTKVKAEFQNPLYPICSFASKEGFEDVLIPTSEDVRRISSSFFFPDKCDNPYANDKQMNRVWTTKISKAFFRGSTTGCGVTEHDNMRIKAHLLSKENPELLDCAVVNINTRLRKPNPQSPLTIPDYMKIIGKPGEFANDVVKSNHKYVLNIDGHSRAYRLSYELSLQSVVLLQESPYKLWFENKLKPFVHFVPIKHDLSDLIEKVKWCKENDNLCLNIAKNASVFYSTYLTKEATMNYFYDVILNIHKACMHPFVIFPKNVKVAVITIYRDDTNHSRRKQKLFFLKRMSKLPVDIYLVEQSKEHPFNIGLLKNIGFHQLTGKYDNIVFTDIDMLPSDDILMNGWFVPRDGVSCLAMSGTRYTTSDINRNIFLGGMISCTSEVFQRANGYPNHFYSWGAEDDALILRFNKTHTRFYIPKKGFVVDNEQTSDGKIKDLQTKVTELKVKQEINNLRWELITSEEHNWNKSGLNNLMYDVIDKQVHDNICHLKVRLPKPPQIQLSTSNVEKEFKRIKWKYMALENNKVTYY